MSAKANLRRIKGAPPQSKNKCKETPKPSPLNAKGFEV